MSKLIRILAASIGGGLVLGAGIRIGEAIVSRRASEPQLGDLLESRLDQIEAKLRHAATPFGETTPAVTPPEIGREWQAVFAGIGAKIDRQQSEVEALRRQMTTAARSLESTHDSSGGAREDMQRQLRDELDQRVAALEEKLRVRMEASQQETAAAMLTVFENRISPRINRLEKDVSGQTEAVSELRECSMKTEQSIQRLIAVLDRTVGTKSEARGREQSSAEDPAFRSAIF